MTRLLGSVLVLSAACAADAEVETSSITGESDIGDVVANANFGCSIVVADFTGDGIDDVAVGACNDGSGAVLIYDGNDSPSLTPTQRLVEGNFPDAGPHTGDQFGFALAARDMDGDGIADLVVGAPNYQTNGKVAGAIFVYKGSHSGLHHGGNGPFVEASPFGVPEDGDRFGASVALGFYDGVTPFVAVAAPSEKPGQGLITGWVEIFRWFSASELAGTQGIVPPNETNGAQFGSALLTADVTGDGIDDLVVGANLEGGVGGGGGVWIYKGGSDINSPVTRGQHILSPTPSGSQKFGTALAAGRFRGGATNELAISGPLTPDSAAGRVFLFKQSGGSLVSEQTLELDSGGFPVSGAALGTSLAAGDLDADGNVDLVAGAPATNGNTGEVVVYRGHAGAAMTQWGTRLPHGDLANPATYGKTVAVGNFYPTFDAYQDMVIGAPTSTISGKAGAGAIQAYKGDGTIPNWLQTFNEGTDF